MWAAAGQMKDILTTGLGLFLFGDVKFDARNVTGVCIGLLGGIAYSLSSYYERQKPPRDAVCCIPYMCTQRALRPQPASISCNCCSAPSSSHLIRWCPSLQPWHETVCPCHGLPRLVLLGPGEPRRLNACRARRACRPRGPSGMMTRRARSWGTPAANLPACSLGGGASARLSDLLCIALLWAQHRAHNSPLLMKTALHVSG